MKEYLTTLFTLLVEKMSTLSMWVATKTRPLRTIRKIDFTNQERKKTGKTISQRQAANERTQNKLIYCKRNAADSPSVYGNLKNMNISHK